MVLVIDTDLEVSSSNPPVFCKLDNDMSYDTQLPIYIFNQIAILAIELNEKP